jgi:hypothetical protein
MLLQLKPTKSETGDYANENGECGKCTVYRDQWRCV